MVEMLASVPFSVLPDSDKIIHGRLPNGFEYYVRSNTYPPNRFETQLEVHAGSLHEDENEQGIAHMLEHCVFLATQKIPSAERLRNLLAIFGMSFGGDTNAYTDVNRTVYMFSSPSAADVALLGSDDDHLPDELRGKSAVYSNLWILHQICFEAIFADETADKERGSVLSEYQMRNTIDYRQGNAVDEQLHYDNMIPQRKPIGLVEQIKEFNAAGMRRFYDRWYQPANMTLYLVGDFDAAECVRLIETIFSPVPPFRTEPCPVKWPLEIPHRLGAPPAEAFKVFQDPLLREFSLSITAKGPLQPFRSSHDYIIYMLDSVIANTLSTRALKIRQESSDPDFDIVQWWHSSSERERCSYNTFTIAAKPDKWRQCVAAGVREAAKLALFGVEPSEVTIAVNAFVKSKEESAEQEETVTSETHLENIMSDAALGSSLYDYHSELEFARALVPFVTEEAVNARAREMLRIVTHFLSEENPCHGCMFISGPTHIVPHKRPLRRSRSAHVVEEFTEAPRRSHSPHPPLHPSMHSPMHSPIRAGGGHSEFHVSPLAHDMPRRVHAPTLFARPGSHGGLPLSHLPDAPTIEGLPPGAVEEMLQSGMTMEEIELYLRGELELEDASEEGEEESDVASMEMEEGAEPMEGDRPEGAPQPSPRAVGTPLVLDHEEICRVMLEAMSTVERPRSVVVPPRLLTPEAILALDESARDAFVPVTLKQQRHAQETEATLRTVAAEVPDLEYDRTALAAWRELAQTVPMIIDPVTGIVRMRLRNGIAINAKATQFERKQCDITIAAQGGFDSEPVGKPSTLSLGLLAMTTGGAAGHDANTITRYCGVHGLNFTANVDSEFTFVGLDFSVSDDGIARALELLHVYMASPNWEKEPWDRAVDDMLFDLNECRKDLATLTDDACYRGAFNGDQRFSISTPEVVRALTFVDAQREVARQLNPAQLECIVVGDFEPASLVANLRTYFGSLPSRPEDSKMYLPRVRNPLPLAAVMPPPARVRLAEDEPKALIKMLWRMVTKYPGLDSEEGPLCPPHHRVPPPGAPPLFHASPAQFAVRVARLWSAVLNQRLYREIREEAGLCYDIGFGSYVYEFYEGGFGLVSVTAFPEKIDITLQKLNEVLTAFNNTTITDDEFQEARKPLVSSVQTNMHNNSYWTSIMRDLQNCQSPKDITHLWNIPEHYAAMTREDVELAIRAMYAYDPSSVAVSVGIGGPEEEVPDIVLPAS